MRMNMVIYLTFSIKNRSRPLSVVSLYDLPVKGNYIQSLPQGN
jgi:hypothetical protein